MEFWQAHEEEWEEKGIENPLDVAPVLWPENRPAWDAYKWLLTFSDGEAIDVTALTTYFRPPHAGSRLEPEARTRVLEDVPELLREDRRIRGERHERMMDRIRAQARVR